MSAPELLYGQRAGATVGADARALDGGARDDVVLRDVGIHYSLFELPMGRLLPRLPEALHPSVPAVLGVSVWRCAESPLGAFTLAYVGVACRTGIKPRHFVYAAFCSEPRVGDWLRGRYGLPCRSAQVHSLETYDRVHSRVETDGHPLLDLVAENPQAVVGRGAVIKISPPLAPARFGDGVGLVQMEASFDFKRVTRGLPRVSHFDAAALGEATLAPDYPVSSAFGIVDVTLHPARFRVDPALPAERGGARKV